MEKICDVIEVVLSLLVGIAVIAALISILPNIFGIIGSGMKDGGLAEILEEVFNIVIAVEFLKMLLKPTSLTVIEVLIFLIARHMILQQTTPAQDLMSVVGICLLLAAKLIISYYKKNQTLPGGHRRASIRPAERDDQTETGNQTDQNGMADQKDPADLENPYVNSAAKDPNQPERVGRGPSEQKVYHDIVRELDSSQEKNAHEE